MNKPNSLQRFFALIAPYFILAFMIVVFVLMFFVFSYIFVTLMVIGLVVIGISYIYTRFFQSKKSPQNSPKKGRIIDQGKE